MKSTPYVNSVRAKQGLEDNGVSILVMLHYRNCSLPIFTSEKLGTKHIVRSPSSLFSLFFASIMEHVFWTPPTGKKAGEEDFAIKL